MAHTELFSLLKDNVIKEAQATKYSCWIKF